MSLEIIHEDERLIAVSKPAGRLVIPGRGSCAGDPTLKAEVEGRTGAKVFVVHRLDREASGLVVFAKDAECHRRLCGQFARRQVHKLYLALAWGAVEQDGIVKAPIREYGSGRMGVHPQGKPARTIFRVLRRFASAALLEVEPLTGRRHQIRVHLYHIGHPILGDDRYGNDLPVGGYPRLMLHARRAVFMHPDGRKLVLETPPGADFDSVVSNAAAG